MPQGVGQAVCTVECRKSRCRLEPPKASWGLLFGHCLAHWVFLGNSVVIETAEHWPIQGMGVMDILGYQGQNDDYEGGFRYPLSIGS